MKKAVALIIVIISLCIGLYIFFTGNKNSDILPKNIQNNNGEELLLFNNLADSNTSTQIENIQTDFNKNDLEYLKKRVDFLNNIYHSKIYSVIIKHGKIKALYDGNETNQTKLLKKFQKIYIPNKLFLKPFKQAVYFVNNDKKLNSFIKKYQNRKNNIIQTAYIFNQYHNMFKDDTAIEIEEQLYSSTEDRVLENNNSMLILNGGFNYLKIQHIRKNKIDTTVYPEYFHLDYDGNGFYCNRDAGASSSIMIRAIFPQINNYDLRFEDEFNQKVLIKFSINTSYYINYGISFLNNNLLSIDVIYNEMGCGGNNTYGYFKTFNIDLKHAKYLKITDFFDEKYIKNDILNKLYKILKTKYECDEKKTEIYKDFINSFTIDRKYLYFYFDEGSVTANSYEYFVVKIPYDTDKLKFKF